MPATNRDHLSPTRLFVILERARAGLGAAGLAAVAAEGIVSTHIAESLLGVFSPLLVPLLAAAAAIVAWYVADGYSGK
jgi:hypothetical protein